MLSSVDETVAGVSSGSSPSVSSPPDNDACCTTEHKLSNLSTIKNRKIQFIELTPIDTNSEIIKVVLGIEVTSKHIYQLVQFGENGTKTILTINKFKSDQNITDELFHFNRLKYETLDYLID